MRIVEDNKDTLGLRWYGADKPSVTTVLDVIVKPYLDKWKREKGEIEAKRISGEATALGTRVHTIFERVARGQPVPYQKHSSFGIEDHERYVQAAHAFLDEYVDRVLATELSIEGNVNQFGGTCDLYALLKTGEYAIFDFKTSKRLSDEVPLQTWAYAALLMETGRRVDRRFAVQIFKTPGKVGTYSVKEYTEHDDDRRGFLGALNLFLWTHRKAIRRRVAAAE